MKWPYMLNTIIFLVILFFQSCRQINLNPAQSIPVFGLDSRGRETVRLIPKKVFAEKFSSHLGAIDGNMHKMLNRKNRKTQKFRLLQIIIGLALSLDLGYTPVFSLGFQPTFQLWYRDMITYN